jgi:hypothetical protein
MHRQMQSLPNRACFISSVCVALLQADVYMISGPKFGVPLRWVFTGELTQAMPLLARAQTNITQARHTVINRKRFILTRIIQRNQL